MTFWPETSTAHLIRRIPVVGERAAGAGLRRNLDRVMGLNGREHGATVFVIGSGPQLNAIPPDHRLELSRRPTIGVNRTQYAVDLRYFMSAYPAEVMLARSHAGRRTTVIHLRPRLEAPLIRDTVTIRRIRHKTGEPLPPVLEMPTPTLHTFKNVVLAATHFALVLGASRLVFVGVEQTNALHFYDSQPSLRERMTEDVRRIRAKGVLTIDHPYADVDHLLQKLAKSPDELAAGPFFADSHEESFREFFGDLRRQGTEVHATTPDSVVARAGASVVGLDEALSW